MGRRCRYKGKCTTCEYRDVVNKKWWGCTTVVCTFNSQMGKALPATENIPAWCPTGGVPKVKEENKKEENKVNVGVLIGLLRSNRMILEVLFELIKKKADEGGRVCIIDKFGIGGTKINADDLIRFLQGVADED